MGNILIRPMNDDPEDTNGCLIDLDYAKATDRPTDPPPSLNTIPEGRYEAFTQGRDFLPENMPVIEKDVFSILFLTFEGKFLKMSNFLEKLLEWKNKWLPAETQVNVTCMSAGMIIKTNLT